MQPLLRNVNAHAPNPKRGSRTFRGRGSLIALSRDGAGITVEIGGEASLQQAIMPVPSSKNDMSPGALLG
jgi:hypothetical protein